MAGRPDNEGELMAAALPTEIVDLDDYTESINGMVYADPGVGKTIFGASDDHVLILAIEQGTVSAARNLKKQGSIVGKNVKVWDCVNNWDAFERAYEWCEAQVAADTMPFQWVVIDTITELQKLMLRDIIDTRIAKSGKGNPDITERQDYQENQLRLQRFVGLFNDLDVNVLYLAHSMQTENEEGDQYVMPMLHGKGNQIASWVSAQVHCFGYMHMVPAKTKSGAEVMSRRIEWTADAKWKAKDRFDVLAPRTIRKTLKDIRLMIEATDEPEAAPAKAAPAKKAAPAAAK